MKNPSPEWALDFRNLWIRFWGVFHFAINNLRDAGYSERRIAETLGVSRGAVRRHLTPAPSNSTTAQTALGDQAPTGSQDSNSTKAPTGSGDQAEVSAPRDEPITSNSQCEPFREIIVAKCELGLSAQRIDQDLVAEHGFEGKYWSVNRFVKSLGNNRELPFRRMEVEPGEELQVDFGTRAKIRSTDGTYRRTHVFRCVLSHSRKGYTEAVWKQDTESFIRTLENAFWALGGVPQRVVFDNAKCAVKTPDWYDPELHPKLVDFCKHYGKHHWGRERISNRTDQRTTGECSSGTEATRQASRRTSGVWLRSRCEYPSTPTTCGAGDRGA